MGRSPMRPQESLGFEPCASIAHFFVSELIQFANSSGVVPRTSMPILHNHSFISGG
jgi:hypothetical protein